MVNMNAKNLNKMKFELIDDLSDSQVELLVKSMILDKYCMDRNELVSNESELIKILQYLIDNDKMLYVLNGVYGAYNELLYDLNFKGFDVSSESNYLGFSGLANAMDNSRKRYDKDYQALLKENQELKAHIERRVKRSQEAIMNPKYVEIYRRVTDELLNDEEYIKERDGIK